MDAVLEALFQQGPTSSGLHATTYLLRVLVAFLAGLIVAVSYMRSHSSLSYSHSYIQALVLLSMVVSMIMMAVGDSLARAFGLGAALAIVRFRTPIKDARDTAFLFLAVASGMAAGTGLTLLAFLGATLTGAAALLLSWSGFGNRKLSDAVLRFRRDHEGADRESIAEILERHCSEHELVGVRTQGEEFEELVYDVTLRATSEASSLVTDLRAQVGIEAVSYLPKANFQDG